jgi:hypothetical protein
MKWANDRIGLKVADEIDERKRLRQIEGKPALVGNPRFVTGDIPPAEEFRKHG